MSQLDPVNKSFCIHTVCESNYYKLLRLAPDLLEMENSAVAFADDKPALYIQIIDKTPYTLTLELSHCFEEEMEPFFEPAVRIRAYTDAKTAEVLQDGARPQLNRALKKFEGYRRVMDYKWSLNYFLEKWLNHCLNLGYRFEQPLAAEQAAL